MEKKAFFSAKNIAYLGVLLALVIVLQLFASAIPMFGITLNFSLVPIVLGGILLGVWGGTIMGFVAGFVTFITTAVMGQEPATAFLFQANPVVLTIVCLGKTTVAGLVAGLLYKPVAKKNKLVAAFVSSVVVPVINTGIYMLGMVIMTNDVAAFLGLEAKANIVFVTVFTIIWLNFVLEIAVNLVFAPAIHHVVLVVEKQIGKKKKNHSEPKEEISQQTEFSEEENQQ